MIAGRKRKSIGASPGLGCATPTLSHSKPEAGNLRDPDRPARLPLVRELVQATEKQALEFWDELCSVQSGPAGAQKTREISINLLTMMLGTTIPLLNALLSEGGAIESRSVPQKDSQPQQNTPLTQTPLTPGFCAPSLENLKCAFPQQPAPTAAQSKRKASDTMHKSVQEWAGVSALDSTEGALVESTPVCKMNSSDRRKCAHAPFTMRFANSLFQGRGEHFPNSFRQLQEISKCRIEKYKQMRDIIQPLRLFGEDDESDPVFGDQSNATARAETRDADNSSLCAAQVSSSKGCSCCRSVPCLGRYRSQSKISTCLSTALESMEEVAEIDGIERTEMDGVIVENYDFEYHPWMLSRPSDESLTESGISTGLEMVVWTPPPPWAPSWWATPAACQAARVLTASADWKHGSQPAPDVDVDAETEALLQQSASRDSGGVDQLYRDTCMQRMDALERELRKAFKRCEDERLEAARLVGWIRRDVDWIKDNARQQVSKAHATVASTVHVPRHGPRRLVASSSGHLSNSGIRYRRLLIAEARQLYLSAAIRQHHEGSLCLDGPNELRLAAVRAILSDLPLEFLRCLSKDPRVQQCAIISAKKMRKKVLRELKEEAAKARKDPMTVLKATIEHSSRAGSIKAYRGMQAILNQSGFGHCLPSDEQMSAAKKGIARLAEADLEIVETPDGYRISLKRAVEMEASRIMQTVAISDTSKLTARTVGVQPGGHRWQDIFDIKITFDARRVTRHGSQTEVMMIFMLKGAEGVERCQKALHHRTIAIWAGKDSRENVQRNLVEMMKEAKELEEEGIVFSIAADSFLTVQESEEYRSWMQLPEQTRKEKCQRMDPESFHNVGIRFWVPADMLAQCSLLGQGCAGKMYCAHCHTDKDARHIPFELRLVPERVNFKTFADQLDLHAETLWSINTCANRGSNWKFTEEGLRFMTAPSNLPVQQQSALATRDPGSKPGAQFQKDSARPRMPALSASTMRPSKSRRSKTQPPAAACATPSNKDNHGSALGPDVGRISKLTTWRVHGSECLCDGCAIPANTIVRTMLSPGFSRPSSFLNEHWPQMTSGRCPFCSLHCLMRVTEAMFKQICQFAMAGGEAHLKRLNDGLSIAGFKSKKFEKLRNFDSKNYEKLSFLGHESLHLLKRKDGTGDRNIAVILKHIWPQGDAPHRLDSVDGTAFVARSLDLWEQWAKVVELMTERDHEKVRTKNGFENFGKECRDFCFLFQAMFHKAQCKAYYLHTLMAHAGDFMRELGKYGMCLGMMSNSGAERRHEYGRRAFKRSLCGGCWAKTNKDLALKRNLSAFLTLREVLTWQYGADLWSHEMALRADSAPAGESIAISSRRELVRKALANLSTSGATGSETDDSVSFTQPLLSFEEADAEMRNTCNLGMPVPCLETDSEGWITVEHDNSKALEFVPFLGEREEGEPLPSGVQAQEGGKLAFLVGSALELTNGIADWISDCSGNGSDDSSSCDDNSSRFEDLADFESDSEDGDYDPASDERLARLVHAVGTGAIHVNVLDLEDAQLIEQDRDGSWQARTAVEQCKHMTRSQGAAESAASIRKGGLSTGAKRQKSQHWGSRAGDIITGL